MQGFRLYLWILLGDALLGNCNETNTGHARPNGKPHDFVSGTSGIAWCSTEFSILESTISLLNFKLKNFVCII